MPIQKVFKAIPFGAYIVLRIISSTKGWRSTGESTKDIQKNWSRVNFSIPRNNLLQARVRDSKKIFPFVLTYNPNLPSVNKLLNKHFHLLLSSPKLKELFPPNSIISSFRRSKNLKEILAPSKCRKGTLESIALPSDASLVTKLDAIFARTSWSTPKLSLAHKWVKRISFGRNSHVIQRM